MKRLTLALAMVCTIALSSIYASTTADPNETLIVRVEEKKQKTLHVFIANLEQEVTKVSIKDLKGNVYFDETVRNHNGYSKNLNLRKLPQGRYLLEINHRGKSLTQVILVENDRILLSRMVEK